MMMNSFYNWGSQPEEKIYVQGEASARAYLVSPNSFVRLWDSSRNVFYEKHADGMGRPTMEAYEYNRIDANTEPTIEDRLKRIEEILNERNESNADDE